MLVSDGKACGVLLEDGTEVESKLVLSNATPHITFETLLPQVRERERRRKKSEYFVSVFSGNTF